MDSMNEWSDLPSLTAIKRIIRHTNTYVMDMLGYVLGMPTTDLVRMRYRILMDNEFTFYFRLGPLQRLRLIRLLKRAVRENVYVSNLIWIFVMRSPPLTMYPEYNVLFLNCLLTRVLSHLELNPISHRIAVIGQIF